MLRNQLTGHLGKQMPPGFRRLRHDSTIMEQTDDAYKARGKLPEPTVCEQCHAVFRAGRWRWGDSPANAHRTLCPACARTNDRYPAGFIMLEGAFVRTHGDEIVNAIRNVEQRQKAEHPLKRIMSLEQRDGGIDVTTTDIHLARGIGDAVHDAYQGELELHYNREDQLLRVYWVRD